jgi:hypothetical protein
MKVDLRKGVKMKQNVEAEVDAKKDVEVGKNAKGDVDNNLPGKLEEMCVRRCLENAVNPGMERESNFWVIL